MLLALVTLVSAASSVSLNLAAGLECPTQTSLAERLAKVGLSVKPQNASVTELLAAPPTFEVSLKPTPQGLLLTAKRTSDAKVFERTVPSGKEDCPTVERLVVVLIHSWIHAKMPVLSPGQRDGGSKR